MSFPTGAKTNCVTPANNQYVEDLFGITNAVAAEISVLPLSDGSYLIQYKGTSIDVADYANIPSGVIFDLAASKVYTKEVGGSWTVVS